MNQGRAGFIAGVLIAFFNMVTASCGQALPSNSGDVETANATPVADAGPDREVVVGTPVTLSAAGSSDLEGAPLHYHWFIQNKPLNSHLEITNSTERDINLLPDAPGLFIVQLHVDDGELTSVPAQTVIRAINNKPVAKPYYYGILQTGQTITLDGTLSYDSDKHPLHFHWQIISSPPGSVAKVKEPEQSKTSFVIDKQGTYVVHLMLNDGYEEAQTVIFAIPVEKSNPQLNLPPVAEAGDDIAIEKTGTVFLNGLNSYDPNNDPLSFRWEILSKPGNSKAKLSNTVTGSPSIDIDVLGSYVIKLTVTDTQGLNHFDTVVVTPMIGGLFCADCHNGKIARDNSVHPAEFAFFSDCNRCHSTTTWYMGKNVPGSFYETIINKHDVALQPERVHNGIVAGCTQCHAKLPQQAYADHPITSSRCNACHSIRSWKTQTQLEHTKALADCRSCHTAPQDQRHSEQMHQCNFCHLKTDWQSLYIPDAHQLTDITICYECHVAQYARPSENLHTTASDLCEHCHIRTSGGWLFAYTDHTQYTSNCAICHNGKVVNGKPSGHLNVSDLCHTCHNIYIWKPSSVFDHTQANGTCRDCHNGKTVTGKKSDHIASTDNCTACHNVAHWIPVDQIDQSQLR